MTDGIKPYNPEMTHKEVAELLGLRRDVVTNWIRGVKTFPEWYCLLKKCESCIRHLLYGTVDDPVYKEAQNTLQEVYTFLSKAKDEEIKRQCDEKCFYWKENYCCRRYFEIPPFSSVNYKGVCEFYTRKYTRNGIVYAVKQRGEE